MWHECKGKLIPFDGDRTQWTNYIRNRYDRKVLDDADALDEMELQTDNFYQGKDGDTLRVFKVTYPNGLPHKGSQWRGKVETRGDQIIDSRTYYSPNDSGGNKCAIVVFAPQFGEAFNGHMTVTHFIEWSGWTEGKVESVKVMPDTTPREVTIEAEMAIKQLINENKPKSETGKPKGRPKKAN